MERRLAAILCSDMVGYSRLIEADEEGTLARQRSHRKELFEPKIAEHHGRIVKSTGDGLLVEFRSVVDAVRCAVSVQLAIAEREADLPEVQRIAYRIGINLGDIVIDVDDIYGDGVNVAARLQALAEPGGICVSRTVVNHVKGKVNSGFEDLGDRGVKNIAEPIRIFRVRMQPEIIGMGNGEASGIPTRWRPALVVAAIAAVVASGSVLWWQPWAPHVEPAAVEGIADPLRARPSIAVLPFDNMSDEPDLVYFSDGITEDIITELARNPDLLVTSRNSSFTYKGEAVKAQQVAQELGVQYVLEGSVRKEAKKVRITAQLVDGRTGHHVWAERIDQEGSNIFQLQDDVTRKIVSTLGGGEGQIRKAAATRAWEKDPASLEEYDYYLRGHAVFYRFTREDIARAREIWLEGLQKFPKSGLLRIKVGWTLFQEARRGWSARPKEDLALAFKLAREGLADETLPPVGQWYGHWLMSIVHLWHSRDFEQARAEAELTFTLVPNDSETIVFSSQIPLFSGDPDLALTWINRGIDLEPQVPAWFYRYLGWASFLRGEYRTAVEQLEITSWPDLEKLQLLAASYSRLGLMEDARAAVADMRKLHPKVSITSLRELLPYRDQTVLEDLLADLRKAGVPE